MNTDAQNQTLAAARASMYRFLATPFLAPPTDGLLTHIQRDEFRALFKEWISGAWDERLVSREDGADVGALVSEYHRLFVVPGAGYVPPYEAVYADTVDIEYTPHQISGAGDMPTRVSGLLHGPSTTAVERAYAVAGFAVPPTTGELPDHLGIELQFLARLCDEQAAAWSAEDAPEARRLQTVEREFLLAHPLRWLPRFRQRLETAQGHAFYRALAQLCESFLRASAALLTE